MNVRELIDLPGRYPGDMRVVVNGYEQGYDDVSPEQVSVVQVVLNVGAHEWEGMHGDVPGGDSGNAATVEALVLARTSN